MYEASPLTSFGRSKGTVKTDFSSPIRVVQFIILLIFNGTGHNEHYWMR